MSEEEYLQETINDMFGKVKAVLDKNTFLCSIYLLKYINDKDEEAYKSFLSIFRKLSLEEMIQVLNDVRANLIEQGKINSKSK